MCRNSICSECVYQRIEEELGVNAASTIKSYYDQWRPRQVNAQTSRP